MKLLHMLQRSHICKPYLELLRGVLFQTQLYNNYIINGEIVQILIEVVYFAHRV